jgi:hypothetical protein
VIVLRVEPLAALYAKFAFKKANRKMFTFYSVDLLNEDIVELHLPEKNQKARRLSLRPLLPHCL